MRKITGQFKFRSLKKGDKMVPRNESVGLLFLRLAILGILLCLCYSPFLLGTKTMWALGHEDGFYEYLTAFCLLGASILFFRAYLRSDARDGRTFMKMRKNVFPLLLSLLFFFGCGEELSWGQRVLKFSTPESVSDANRQEEFNIHNLKLVMGEEYADGAKKSRLAIALNPTRLFSVFWLVYCVLLPIVSLSIAPVGRMVNRIGIPIVPLWIGLFFPLNYVVFKCLESSEIAANKPDRIGLNMIAEFKECYHCFLFLVFALFNSIKVSPSDVSTSSPPSS